MSLKSYEKHLLSKEWQDSVKDFDCCGEAGGNLVKLNQFLKNNALSYNQDNLSRTNIFVENGKCIAYYSLAMNAIKEPKIDIEEKYAFLKSYPAVFLTRFAIDKSFQQTGLGKDILNSIIRNTYKDKETGARFLFLDAYPESVSWYLNNPLFEILYTALSERIEHSCEEEIIIKLNERLKGGYSIECELTRDENLDTIKKNCSEILMKHVNKIFEELVLDNPILKVCNSKVNFTFEDNRPKIELNDFNSRKKSPLIREWLQNKENILNFDITIPIYVDINKYYTAIFG